MLNHMPIFMHIFAKGGTLLQNVSAVSISVLAIFCAIMLVISRHPVHSILYLVGVFFCISAHYILLNAQFLAIVNIIVYAGAIMVLFLFVVMLMNLNKAENRRYYLLKRLPAVLLSLLFLLTILVTFYCNSANVGELQDTLSPGNIGLTKTISATLFSDYALPFELTALLFFSAVLAGVVLARKSNKVSSSE